MAKPLAELARNAREELGKAIVGYGDALDTLFLTLVCGGHALLEECRGSARPWPSGRWRASSASASAASRARRI